MTQHEETQGAPAWREGLQACLPVMIGYFPVGMAFGIAGAAVGLGPWAVIAVSVFVYAGASQFLLLAAIKAGTPWLGVVALGALLNARHLLYGPLLSRWLPKALGPRLRLAFLLTDEVFATALHRLEAVPAQRRQCWMMALGLGAWLTWIGGTVVGVYAGAGLDQRYPMLADVMRFALPALFIALVCQSGRRGMWLPIAVALICAGGLSAAGYATAAIIVGAAAGCAASLVRGRT